MQSRIERSMRVTGEQRADPLPHLQRSLFPLRLPLYQQRFLVEEAIRRNAVPSDVAEELIGKGMPGNSRLHTYRAE